MNTFHNWLEEHENHNLYMPCDLILPTIAAAGPNGISVEELRGRFKEMKIDWLAMLERYGAIVPFIVGKKRFYRSTSS